MTLGSDLKKARERAGLSIEQIAARTKIQSHKIAALEADNFDGLPTGIYFEGIVRAYAQEVGIDSVPLIDRARREWADIAGGCTPPIERNAVQSLQMLPVLEDINVFPTEDIRPRPEALDAFRSEDGRPPDTGHVAAPPPVAPLKQEWTPPRPQLAIAPPPPKQAVAHPPPLELARPPREVGLPLPAGEVELAPPPRHFELGRSAHPVELAPPPHQLELARPMLLLVAAACVAVAFYQATPQVERDTPLLGVIFSVPSPVAEPATPLAPAPTLETTVALPDVAGDLSGAWTLETRVDSTRLKRYAGLQLGYQIELQRDGDRVNGKGRKVTENGVGLRPAAQTPIYLDGTVNGDRVTLAFTERGNRRQTHGTLRLQLENDERLRGRFTSTAARSSGIVEARRVQ